MALPRPGFARLLLLITPRAVGLVDALLIAACLAALLGIGIYYARRQRTTEEYFVSGRNRRSFIPGISLVAAMFSLVAYIGNPGEVVQNGPVLACAVLVALPFGYLAVGWLLIPLIMRLPITSAYELLEVRLGRPVRLLGAGIFVSMRVVWMSLILCTAATVLVAVMDCGSQWVPAFEIGLCLVATTYTLIGGIDAVMLTSVLEYFLLILGALLTIGSISWRMGGITAWWPHHWQAHWHPQPFFSLNPHVRVTAVGTFLGYVISTICGVGSDQVAIQRYLTTRDAATARRAFLTGAIGIGSLMIVLTLVGLALLGFYSQPRPAGCRRASASPAAAMRSFPTISATTFPAGASGLVISALLASGGFRHQPRAEFGHDRHLQGFHRASPALVGPQRRRAAAHRPDPGLRDRPGRPGRQPGGRPGRGRPSRSLEQDGQPPVLPDVRALLPRDVRALRHDLRRDHRHDLHPDRRHPDRVLEHADRAAPHQLTVYRAGLQPDQHLRRMHFQPGADPRQERCRVAAWTAAALGGCSAWPLARLVRRLERA